MIYHPPLQLHGILCENEDGFFCSHSFLLKLFLPYIREEYRWNFHIVVDRFGVQTGCFFFLLFVSLSLIQHAFVRNGRSTLQLQLAVPLIHTCMRHFVSLSL
ncbi:hypothetical protein L1049_012970 [Liquidambar formosana]|uniref:Uncharacterized protein n=1 Tax=Liquidambar formosana TaxID=63359 RepID=A0AAP0RJG9_LIQFO